MLCCCTCRKVHFRPSGIFSALFNSILISMLGAAMAVEDGVALAQALSKISSRSEIPEALSTFEAVRIKRTGQMQEASLLENCGTLQMVHCRRPETQLCYQKP
jgi:hypothetical protein